MFKSACVHRSFTIIAKSRARDRRFEAANQPRAIRAKNRFWRAPMRREAGEHENFFIAKNRDSESAKRVFGRHSGVATTLATCRATRARITETSAGQAFPAISIIG